MSERVSELAIQTVGLGKRYGSTWALRDCSIEVPAGSVSGLVGANGAGKTTLMRLLVGASRATSGSALVDGMAPRDERDFLRRVGYLAQEIPLYRRWTAHDHLALGAHLNPSWDGDAVRARLTSLHIPLDRRMEALSGGMRAQVALGLALGKRPRVLLLDEPVAALDPLARREFLASLAAAVADGDLTVLLSTHLLADLERVCDHLVLIAEGEPVLCADIDELVATHKHVRGPLRDTSAIARQHQIINEQRSAREVALVVRTHGPLLDPSWQVDDLGLEEIVLAYLARSRPGALPTGAPHAVEVGR